MGYMTGMTDEVEKALFLRKFNVPFWALSYVFGRDPSYCIEPNNQLAETVLLGQPSEILLIYLSIWRPMKNIPGY